MADRITAAARTRNAIKAAADGELGDARSLLVESLQADRDYAPAWLWFAAVAKEPEERLFCLLEAQRLSPTRATDMAIAQLRDVEPEAPDELTAFTDPPPPELVEGFQEDALARRRRRRIAGVVVLLAVLLVGAGVFWYSQQDRRAPVYFAVVGADATQPGPGSGQEVEAAARWAARQFNTSQRLPDRRIEIRYYNDGNDPVKAVEIANTIVADGRFLGVIGHHTSVTSEAAGPIYAAANLPAITPSATGDGVTADNPWYFRTIFNNSQQGTGISDYAATFLGTGSAAILAGADSYGTTLADGFRQAWSTQSQVVADLVVPTGSMADPARVDALVAQVVQSAPTGPIFIGTDETAALPWSRGCATPSSRIRSSAATPSPPPPSTTG